MPELTKVTHTHGAFGDCVVHLSLVDIVRLFVFGRMRVFGSSVVLTVRRAKLKAEGK